MLGLTAEAQRVRRTTQGAIGGLECAMAASVFDFVRAASIVAFQCLDPTARRSGRLACFRGWKQTEGLFPSKPKMEVSVVAISAAGKRPGQPNQAKRDQAEAHGA